MSRDLGHRCLPSSLPRVHAGLMGRMDCSASSTEAGAQLVWMLWPAPTGKRGACLVPCTREARSLPDATACSTQHAVHTQHAQYMQCTRSLMSSNHEHYPPPTHEIDQLDSHLCGSGGRSPPRDSAEIIWRFFALHPKSDYVP